MEGPFGLTLEFTCWRRRAQPAVASQVQRRVSQHGGEAPDGHVGIAQTHVRTMPWSAQAGKAGACGQRPAHGLSVGVSARRQHEQQRRREAKPRARKMGRFFDATSEEVTRLRGVLREQGQLANVGVHLLAEAGEARCSQSGATTG